MSYIIGEHYLTDVGAGKYMGYRPYMSGSMHAFEVSETLTIYTGTESFPKVVDHSVMGYIPGKWYQTLDGPMEFVAKSPTGQLMFSHPRKDWFLYFPGNVFPPCEAPRKPIVDWAAMPAWAVAVAMDDDSVWYWYDSIPENDGKHDWLLQVGYYNGLIPPSYKPKFDGDWKDSLVTRPEHKE